MNIWISSLILVRQIFLRFFLTVANVRSAMLIGTRSKLLLDEVLVVRVVQARSPLGIETWTSAWTHSSRFLSATEGAGIKEII